MPSRRAEQGFTLIELLVAMLIGGLILAALLSVFTVVLDQTTRVNGRLEAGQTGRRAIDRVTTLLDSQVCVGAISPLLSGNVATAMTNATSVTFYADVGGTTFTPRKYRIYLDVDGSLKEQRFDPTSATAPYGWPNTNAANSTRIIATKVTQTVDAGGVTQPIFKYYGYNAATSAPTLPLSVAPTAVDVTRAVRVEVKFTIAPPFTGGARRSAAVQGEAYSATASPPDLTSTPPDPNGGPGCS